MNIDQLKIEPFDERRDLLIPGSKEITLDICIRHFIATARDAIKDHGSFFVALAGGSTPKAVYEKLASDAYKEQIDWTKVYLFFGDERSVSPEDPESNYKMALDAGLATLPIPKEHIFRMEAEENIEENALKYEENLKKILQGRPLDLVILGMGPDGHTASLFPQTEGLKAENRLVVANFVPQKNTWRMTLTYEAINNAQNIVIYILGSEKKETLRDVLMGDLQPERYPIQLIGTKENKALWIADELAAELLNNQ